MTATLNYSPPVPPVWSATRRGGDCWGSGHFGAPRGLKQHNGLDFLVAQDSPVYSTITGKVTKLGICYRDDIYRYVQVEDESGHHVRHFYVSPLVRVGDYVTPTAVLGRAQDLTKRYPADDIHPEPIPNHIHLEIVKAGTLYRGKQFIDPDLYIFA